MSEIIIKLDIKNDSRFCLDCQKDTVKMGEYYMVKNFIWKKANPKEKGMLCIGCLEKRLGGTITFGAFTHCPLNCMPYIFRSERLARRLHTL